jgi:hypothetical protein
MWNTSCGRVPSTAGEVDSVKADSAELWIATTRLPTASPWVAKSAYSCPVPNVLHHVRRTVLDEHAVELRRVTTRTRSRHARLMEAMTRFT